MGTLTRALVISIAAWFVALMGAAPAQAYSSQSLTICNKSPDVLQKVAIGYHSAGVNDPADHSLLTGPFVTRGWWKIQPGECATFDNPFNARYMYWFGATANFNANAYGRANDELQPQNNDFNFCIPEYLSGQPTPTFTFEAENAKDVSGRTDACFQDGVRTWVAFRMIDTWVDATVNFTGR